MNVSLYQAAAALNANAKWQEVLSGNLAAVSVPGYKKQEVSFGRIEAGLMPQGAGPSQPMSLPTTSIGINFSQGNLKFTGSPTDLALEGPGFLTVELPNGQEGYTRDGEFRFDPFGQLITKQGYPVMGNGGPIQVDLTNAAPISISANGGVSQGPDLVGQIQVVEFENPQLLTQTQAGYFLATQPNLNFGAATETTVRQNYLETSNASSITEMTQLITALRSFESNQRIVQIQDERLGRLISELGSPT